MKGGNMPALTLRVAELQEVVLMSTLYTIKDDVNWAVAKSCREVTPDLIFPRYEEIAAELLSTVQARTSAEQGSYKAVARYTQGSYNSVAKYSTATNRRQLHFLKSQKRTSKTLLPCTPTHHLLSSVLSQATPPIPALFAQLAPCQYRCPG